MENNEIEVIKHTLGMIHRALDMVSNQADKYNETSTTPDMIPLIQIRGFIHAIKGLYWEALSREFNPNHTPQEPGEVTMDETPKEDVSEMP